ncbi:hypothetical protein [Lysinibacillus sphaericus]|nr:hypothetical protein [Lysinibacillus sphaericus]
MLESILGDQLGMSICGARQEPLLVVLILVVEYVSYRVRIACKG